MTQPSFTKKLKLDLPFDLVVPFGYVLKRISIYTTELLTVHLYSYYTAQKNQEMGSLTDVSTEKMQSYAHGIL